MKIKSLFVLFLILSSTILFAQNTTVKVFIDGSNVGQYTIKNRQTDGGVSFKKSTYKKLDDLVIEVKGNKLKSAKYYKRSVDITDTDGSSLFVAEEALGLKGRFVLTDRSVLRKLSKGKVIKLYLQLNPITYQSKVSSERIYIGSLSTDK